MFFLLNWTFVWLGGAAYALGRLNSECWYLYTLNKPMSISEPDQTLEIIMTKLDPEVMSIFTKNVCSTAEEATQVRVAKHLEHNIIWQEN